MRSYAIADTTKEQRAEFVANAEAINALGAIPLTKANQALLQTYVDGKIELKALQQIAIDKYKK
ncbi:hypothetical protein CHCC20442_2287 [Bacillus licheniformis]|uniref:antitoxin VbhA family protein n=1 Tax=Bacillus licheniformis TaxID=1402 RepID=UPI00119FAD1D|nr:antitoxin VbhA family protein [Bacillus licheniformis]TWK08842.1 hypothetical protein CHCC20442_2287 [Bacillus licheniformis]